MKTYVITGLVVLVAGIGIGSALTGNPATPIEDDSTAPITPTEMLDTAPPKSSEPDQLAQEITQIKQRLAAEITAREKLEVKLAALTQQIAKNNQSENGRSDEEKTESATNEFNTVPEHNPDNGLSRRQQALLSLGMDNAAMERIQRRAEQQEMQELYLRDRATREGWFGTERYFQESRKLDQTGNVYRQELGDARYDRFLYDTEQNNRIGIQSVLAGSPAETAGLRDGDTVLSYDNERVFTWNDLTTATTKGTPGQTVRVDVLRNGRTLSLYLPRGPLGIRLNSSRVEPN